MSYLTFISDDELICIVAEILSKGIEAKNNVKIDRNFNKNVIDPFTTLFDAAISGFDHETWKEAEATRQYQKTLTNGVGYFHQKLLGSTKDWTDLATGGELDIKSDSLQIIAEIKNKHNTLTGAKRADQYHNLVSKVSKKTSSYYGYTAYFVNIVPKKPERFNTPFIPSDPSTGAKVSQRSDVRIIDGASFYHLVTGRVNALQEVYDCLPQVINEAFRSLRYAEKSLKEPELYAQYFTKAFE